MPETKKPTEPPKRTRVQMFLGDELLADSEHPISSEEAEVRIARAILKLPAHLRPDPASSVGQDYAGPPDWDRPLPPGWTRITCW